MAHSATNTYTGAGLAEDFQDVIFDISPEETPLISMAKKMKASATLHQWQTDSLAAAGGNRQSEGLDATFATLPATTVLNNYCQISSKFVQVSETYDAVKKYGRKSELAYQLVKAGKELKRDMEYAAIRNQASSAGAGAAGTPRSSAGFESWISGNRVLNTGNTTGTTPAYTSSPTVAPTDGTAGTFVESDLVSALELAWIDGGDASEILMSSVNKRRFSAFAGIATKYNEVKGKAQGIVTGAADIYVSDYGNHTVRLDRFMRDQAVLCIDPEYVGIATLRPMKKTQLAKTGDSEKWQINTEWTLAVLNPNAHAKVATVGS